MNELALFAGAGGGILGGKILGWHTVGAVEIEKYPRECLLARQRDGVLDAFPIWDDVCTFDGKPWRGCVDVVSGGFPCQDISSAGKGAGIEGARSGLWKEMCRLICEVRPRYAFMENSPMLTSRGLGVVLEDLAEAGYDAEWMVLGAADVGAPHRRDRIWILARDRRCKVDSHADLQRLGWRSTQPRKVEEVGCVAGHANGEHELQEQEVFGGCREVAGPGRVCCEVGEYTTAPDTNAHSVQCTEQECQHEGAEEFGGGCNDGVEAGGYVPYACESQCEGVDCVSEQCTQADSGTGDAGGVGCFRFGWTVEPDVGRVADGVAARVDRLKAIGNGQVPLVAATAFYELLRRFEYGAE